MTRTIRWLTPLLVVLLLSCGQEDDAPKDDAGAKDDVTVEDGAVADGSPGDGTTSGGCTGDTDCPGQRCHTGTGACVDCLLDQHCDGAEVCVGQSCVSATSCKSDKDCQDLGAVCVNNQCADCASDADCSEGTSCKGHHCLPAAAACKSSKDCSDEQVCNKAAGECVDCTGDEDCPTTSYCADGLCLKDVCAVADTKCKDPKTLDSCKANGSGWEEQACGVGKACADGSCQDVICTPAAKSCQDGKVATCGARGVAWGDGVACKADETCKDGACLPQTCKPGEAKCAPGAVETCAADGLSWGKSDCAKGEACDETSAKCTAMICAPGELTCDGDKVAVCGAKGLTTTDAIDCAKLPGGVAGTCAAGACVPKACQDGDKACGATASLSCSQGAWVATPCAAGKTCSGGACMDVACVPNEVYCDLTVLKKCDTSGKSAAWVQDCQVKGEGCKAGKCEPLVCTPGKTKCSDDHSTADTCKADGFGWVELPCGQGQTCEGGACKKVVCDKGTSFCDGQQVKQCNALGTAAVTQSTCEKGKACLKGACVPQLCTPGSSQCAKSGAVETCNGQGLAWLPSACPVGKACHDGDCHKVVCTDTKPICGGTDQQQVLTCDDNGTKQNVKETCGKGTYCKDGVCAKQICTPAATQCAKDGTLETCAKDGLSWGAVGCPKGEACDGGACKKVICQAGTKSCKGLTEVQTCNDSGTQQSVSATCPAKTSCKSGACTKWLCTPKTSQCGAMGDHEVCAADGLSWTPAPCDKGQKCDAGSCKPVVCGAGKDFCDKAAVRSCNATGTGSTVKATCTAKQACVSGSCVDLVCTASESKCGGDGKLLTCKADGLGWVDSACPKGQTCAGKGCKPVICEAGKAFCDEAKVMQCDATGTSASVKSTCTGAQVCVSGTCQAKVCSANESKCAPDGKLLTCAANGLSWVATGCGTNKVCEGGGCADVICQAKSAICKGAEVWTCNALGTKSSKTTTCGAGTSCQGGECKKQLCAPKSTRCAASGKLETCAADGLSWGAAACASGQACAGGQCKKLICAPGKAFCDQAKVMQCDATGTAASQSSTCGAGTVCVDGACKKLLCAPGATQCAADGGLQTCAANGLSWVSTSCGSGKTCDSGACKAVVCTAKALVCDGKKVLQCNATGTATTLLTTCGDGKGCLKGACVPQVCTPKSVSCVGGKLRTCNDDGTQYTDKDCGAGNVCADNQCKKQVCNPIAKYCAGSRIVACLPDGTNWESKIDCNDTKASCVNGGCVKWICTPKEVACQGNGVGVCADDGLKWNITPCSDGNACTPDGCKDAKCSFGPSKVCDDKNPCTKDACNTQTGACGATPFSGPCDDGDACTTGEQCDQGKCTADKGGTVDLVAGSGTSGFLDGAATSARFYQPFGVTEGDKGEIYVADYRTHRIRMIAPDGQVSTFAGSGKTGYTNGDLSKATFYYPRDVLWDPLNKRLLLIEGKYNCIRSIQNGVVSTLAGHCASYGWVDHSNPLNARFRTPTDLNISEQGSVVVTDHANHSIRLLDKGVVSTLAGAPGTPGFADGPKNSARFNYPFGADFGPDGNVYVADSNNQRIRKVTMQGMVTTLAGVGSNGFLDGPGKTARFYYPRSILRVGNALLVSDTNNRRLRRVSLLGEVTTVAGTSNSGYKNGPALQAWLKSVFGMARASDGTILLADVDNHRVRRFSPGVKDCDDGQPCTADSCDKKTAKCSHTPISAGQKCDDGDACTLGETCDAKGGCAGKAKDCSDGKVCTKDLCDSTTGKCSNPGHEEACSDGDACTVGDACKAGACVGGLGVLETVVGTGIAGTSDGKALEATLNTPLFVTVNAAGELFWTEYQQHVVRKLDSKGQVTTIAGKVGAVGDANGVGTKARFNSPRGILASKGGVVFVAEYSGNRVRRISPAGTVSLFAGAGTPGYVDGPGDIARFKGAYDLAQWSDGTLVVADRDNHRIRLVSPTRSVSTLAGSGSYGYLDGPGASARFYAPQGLDVDGSNNVYVADVANNRIRKITPAGQVSTLAGTGSKGYQDGAATSAQFTYLFDVALMADGGLLITDSTLGHLRLLKGGQVSTLVSKGSFADGGFHVAKMAGALYGAAALKDGGAVVVDYAARRIRKASFGVPDCDDHNPCTTDACSKSAGCTHTPGPAGNACDDGDACTTGTTCQPDGACKGTTKSCDDGNSCTTDSCDPWLGTCANEANTLPCNDGSACTTGEQCYDKSCTAELPELKTLAGGSAGFQDGKGSAARFQNPYNLAVVGDEVWVADTSNDRIRRVKQDGTVTTLAGGSAGFADGKGTAAKFNDPFDVAVAPDGSALVPDRYNQAVRRVQADGTVTTYAGGNGSGFVDGPRKLAKFNLPQGLDVNASGAVAVADTGNQRIRVIGTDGKVTTLAGSGSVGFVDGPGASAKFNSPSDVAWGDGGALYVPDPGNNRLRRVLPSGTVETIAGTGEKAVAFGPAKSAKLYGPRGIAITSDGTLYLTLTPVHRVVRLKGGLVQPVFGNGTAATTDGVLDEARLSSPTGLALDKGDQLYIATVGGDRIRAMRFNAVVCDDGKACTTDSCDAKTGKCLFQPLVIGASCSDGNACTVGGTCDGNGACKSTAKDCDDKNVCTEDSCHTLTGECVYTNNLKGCDDGDACTTGETCFAGKCQNDVGLVTTLAGGSASYVDGTMDKARFNKPWDIAEDKSGNWYIADRDNHRIRKVSKGSISTLSGSGTSGYLDGAGSSARFTYPSTLAVRSDGSLAVYGRGYRLRTVAADGTVGTLAGSGSAGFLDGFATSAKFAAEPGGMIEGKDGKLYLADAGNHRIRTVDATKTVATFAGSGGGFLDGPAASAKFNWPQDIDFAPDGSLYVADSSNRRIRRIAGGQVTTVAGNGNNAYVDGPALAGSVSYPDTVNVDAAGRVFFFDAGASKRLRMLSGGQLSTVAGDGITKATDGFGTAAQVYNPQGAIIGSDGHLTFVSPYSHTLRRVLMPKKICHDGKLCTSDTCDKLTGKCDFTPLPDGSACSDPSKPCTQKMSCSNSVCQGGTVKDCNDNNACSIDACDAATGECTHKPATGCFAYHRVFLTSEVYNGDLGGVTGADAKCAGLAQAAGLGGTWQAWISDHQTWPAKRFPIDSYGFRRVDGGIVAHNWSDLTNGSIGVPINVTEKGTSINASTTQSNAASSSYKPKVFTGTHYQGTRSNSSSNKNCKAWTLGTSNSSSYYAAYGDSDYTNTGWTIRRTDGRCADSYKGHLYCFETSLHFSN